MLVPSAVLRHTKKLDSDPTLPGKAFDGSMQEPFGQRSRGDWAAAAAITLVFLSTGHLH